jgi:hypothetical protein
MSTAGAAPASRVALRRPRKSDGSWLETWFSAWQQHNFPASNASDLLAESDRDVSIILRDGVPIGVITWSATGAEGMIHTVAIEPAHTRLGAGMQAAALAERRMTTRGVRMIFAPAPDAHGISVYFWIRLGYRPLLRADWPCDRKGVVWMRRDITGPEAARQTKGSQSRIALKTSSP